MSPDKYMPTLKYLDVYTDLRDDLDTLFDKISCRTEIRFAKKNGIIVKIIEGKKDPQIVADCVLLQRALLKRKMVPFPFIFKQMLEDEKNVLFVGYKDGKIVSFILINPRNATNIYLSDHKLARLELQGNDDEYKRFCAVYLLVWSAITYLKERGYEYLFWGYSHYINCPDPEFESVAFFKRKWNIVGHEVEEPTSLSRYIYFRYLRRFAFVKKIVYLIKLYILKQEWNEA